MQGFHYCVRKRLNYPTQQLLIAQTQRGLFRACVHYTPTVYHTSVHNTLTMYPTSVHYTLTMYLTSVHYTLTSAVPLYYTLLCTLPL